MGKATKIWLIIATSFVIAGSIIFAVVLLVYQGDFTKFATVKYETNTYEVNEDFSNISINSDVADIKFVLSEDDKCRVECVEEVNVKHTVTVKEDTLVIERADEDFRKVQIGINIGEPKITVYLPKTEYTSLVIEESTGDIEIPKDFKFEDVDISISTGDVKFYASVSGLIEIQTSTGDVELNDVQCKNLISKGTTGDIALKSVIATEKFSIERSTGDIYFDNADAAEIFVKTDTGDVTGTLLSEKTFVLETDTGDIDVPKNTTGGRCEITTDTGDIQISILEWSLWGE